MRSGLQKPGAIPFLALIIFSLLSLVPSLAREWELYNIHLGYIGLPRDSNRPYLSRVKNVSVDTRSRPRGSDSPCKPWLLGASYPSCLDQSAHPPQLVVRTSPRSSIEAAAESETNPITFSATKASSSLTRGVNAFKEYVIKHWDDRHIFQSLPTRHEASPDTNSMHPTPTFVGLSVSPSAPSGGEFSSKPHDELEETSLTERVSDDSLFLQLRLLLHESWQQACHTGGIYFESFASRFVPHRHINSLMISNTSASAVRGDEQTCPERSQPETQPGPERTSVERPSSNSSSSAKVDLPKELGHSLSDPTRLPSSLAARAGQPRGTGRDSEHIRGSSMAIVISLVVGIMWF